MEITLRPRTTDVGSSTVPYEWFERSLPHVVCHGRILETNVSWNRDGVLRFGSSVGVEENLRTADIELVVRRGLVRLMQGKNCRSKKIVATREILRNRNGQMAVVGDQFLATPLRSIVTIAVDTEPSISNSLVLDGRVDLLHVDFTWPLVALVNGTSLRTVGPKAVLKGHLGPCLDTTDSIYAVLTVDAYIPLALPSAWQDGFDSCPKLWRECRRAMGER